MNRANRLHAAYLEALDKPLTGKRWRRRVNRLKCLSFAAMMGAYAPAQTEMELA